MSLTWTQIVVAAGVVAYMFDRVATARGWTPTSKALRQENVDLLRRNTELEDTVLRHERTIAEQSSTLALLKEQVAELQVRDQKAVLAQLELHERNANDRYERVKAGDQFRHEEHVALLQGIQTTLTAIAAAQQEEASHDGRT